MRCCFLLLLCAGWLAVWPGGLWPGAGSRQQPLAHSVLLALNLFNSGDILRAQMPHMLELVRRIGVDNVFVSVFENGAWAALGAGATPTRSRHLPAAGSHDDTKQLLEELQHELSGLGVRHAITTSNATWRDYLPTLYGPQAAPESTSSAAAAAATRHKRLDLRDISSTARIPVMARVRNQALKPLWAAPWVLAEGGGGAGRAATTAGSGPLRVANPLAGALGASDTGAGASLPEWAQRAVRSLLSLGPGTPPLQRQPGNLGLPAPIKVLFLNDILLRADDALALLATRGGQYDMACALDFDLLQLYDTWVVRDAAGGTLSPWWPHLRQADAQAALRAGKPFPVSQCWNGMVALDAPALVASAALFRPWYPGEPRGSPPPRNASDAPPPAQPWMQHLLTLWQTVRTVWVRPPGGGHFPPPPASEGEWTAAVRAGVTSTSSAPLMPPPHPVADAVALREGVYGARTCAVSECALLGRDLAQAGHPRILVNPSVRVYYNTLTWWLQRGLMEPLVNPLLLTWANQPARAVGTLRGCGQVGDCGRVPPQVAPGTPVPHTAWWRVLADDRGGGTSQATALQITTDWPPGPASTPCGLSGGELLVPPTPTPPVVAPAPNS